MPSQNVFHQLLQPISHQHIQIIGHYGDNCACGDINARIFIYHFLGKSCINGEDYE